MSTCLVVSLVDVLVEASLLIFLSFGQMSFFCTCCSFDAHVVINMYWMDRHRLSFVGVLHDLSGISSYIVSFLALVYSPLSFHASLVWEWGGNCLVKDDL